MKRISENEFAISGGSPVRDTLLPYGRQWLDDDDIRVVVNILKTDWLTTGSQISEFERSFTEKVAQKVIIAFP